MFNIALELGLNFVLFNWRQEIVKEKPKDSLV